MSKFVKNIDAPRPRPYSRALARAILSGRASCAMVHTSTHTHTCIYNDLICMFGLRLFGNGHTAMFSISARKRQANARVHAETRDQLAFRLIYFIYIHTVLRVCMCLRVRTRA